MVTLTEQFLKVKFFIPQARQDLVKRPLLIEKFASGLCRPLTLISAPAGFGKSTLLGMWIDQKEAAAYTGPRFDQLAWLSLDPTDNQSNRFWIYVVAALQSGFQVNSPDVEFTVQLPFDDLFDLLQIEPPPPIQSFLDRLINSITSYNKQILLILDDYHHIQSPQIHEQMTYLIDHCPSNLHLVISTRADPPLPISRLRARRQLSEFRSIDLRFLTHEIAEFFKISLSVDLPEQQIQTIESSTEGWIAGLQMAALALQTRLAGLENEEEKSLQDKIRDFIASFSGKDIYILDFLANEVFNSQPEEIQAFLLKTSVLDRMNANLCEALILPENTEEGEIRHYSARKILDYLEKANLFLIPLDHERTWFRYHHLFADLLRVRQDQNWPGLKRQLNLRASIWFEENGAEEEAIAHALAAQDWDRSARLIEKNIQEFLELGQLSKVVEWISRLPKDISQNRAGLCIKQAWVMGIAQRQNEFISLLNTAKTILAQNPVDGVRELSEVAHLQRNLEILRAYQAVIEGKPRLALELLKKPLEVLPTGNLWEDSWTYWIKGFTNRIIGDFEQAINAFNGALNICEKRLWVDMVCYTDLAVIYHQQGRLQEAQDTFLHGLALQKYHTAANHGYLARLIAGLCDLLLDRLELDEAKQYGETGFEWLLWWPSGNTWSDLFTVIGRVRLAEGDLKGAAELILRADRERHSWPLRPVNNSLVDDALTRLWLAQSDIGSAVHWAKTTGTVYQMMYDPDQIPDECLLNQLISLARIRLAQASAGDLTVLGEAERMLASLETASQKSGRLRYFVEVGILHAIASQLMDSPDGNRWNLAALNTMEKCLSSGEASGIILPFIEGGPLVEKMLLSLQSRFSPTKRTGYSLNYLNNILLAFRTSPSLKERRPSNFLVEQISDREREVLRLMAAGLSNREIGVKMILSEGTIKSHIHHLFGKLDVQSRTQAIARAKELNIL